MSASLDDADWEGYERARAQKSHALWMDTWSTAIEEWVDEVTMLAGEDPDFEAVQVMTEELFDAAPLVVLLAILPKGVE